MKLPKFRIVQGDIVDLAVDVLALKYAQSSLGADSQVTSLLVAAGEEAASLRPKADEFEIVSGREAVAASEVLFIGVSTIWDLGYHEIRLFARRVLAALAISKPRAKSLAVTLHGVNVGLDEREVLASEVAGFLEAIEAGDGPAELESIAIVEHDRNRAMRLTDALEELVSPVTFGKRGRTVSPQGSLLQSAGRASDFKDHIFVAMPFKESMDDVYHYGVDAVVSHAGYLCERADLSYFTGDALQWVRSRIQSASCLIAELSDPNPNVYLEVGYAWGCGVPTLLVTRDPDTLPFDVRGQRCLVYKSIRDLEKNLGMELHNLVKSEDAEY